MRNRETLALLLACASAFSIANAQGGDESTDEGVTAGTEQQGDRPEMRPRGARLSDEQRQAMRDHWKNMSDEERAAMRKKMRARAGTRGGRGELSEEERAAMKERWENMSDEERAAAREQMREHNRNNGQKDGQTRKAENTGES